MSLVLMSRVILCYRWASELEATDKCIAETVSSWSAAWHAQGEQYQISLL